MLKYHLQRDRERMATVSGLTSHLPLGVDEAQAMNSLRSIEQRNLQPQKEAVQRLYSDANNVEKKFHILKSQCLKENADLRRVKALLNKKYDYEALRDVRRHINQAIRTLNTGFLHRPRLRRLRYRMRLVDHVRQWIRKAEDDLQKSNNELRTAYNNHKKNEESAVVWIANIHERQRYRMRSLISDSVLEQLMLLLTSSRYHSENLRRRAEYIKRYLDTPIQKSHEYISRKKMEGATISSKQANITEHLPVTPTDKDSITLREKLDKKPGRQQLKKCKNTELYEGSGSGEGEHIDFEIEDSNSPPCEEDFGDDTKNTIIPNGKDYENDLLIHDKDEIHQEKSLNAENGFSLSLGDEMGDFTFDEKTVVTSGKEAPHSQAHAVADEAKDVQRINKELRNHAEMLLKRGDALYIKAKNLNSSRNAMLQRRTMVQGRFSDISRRVVRQRDMKGEIDNMARVFHDARSQFHKHLDKIEVHVEELPIQIHDAITLSRVAVSRAYAKYMGKEEAMPMSDAGRKDDYYNDYYYYNDEESTIFNDFDYTEMQKDIETRDYNAMFQKGRDIKSNRIKTADLKKVTMASHDRLCEKMGTIHTKMADLRSKVQEAWKMLDTMQLSIKKSRRGFIQVPVAVSPTRKDMTTVRVCLKPASLDGSILILAGDDSEDAYSYGASLNNGIVTVTTYGPTKTSVNQLVLERSVTVGDWYTLQIQRIGQFLNVSLEMQDEVKEIKSLKINTVKPLQSSPNYVFVGGLPVGFGITNTPWDGCLGDLTVDGKTLDIFRPDSEGVRPSLCQNHCSTNRDKASTIFSGHGFLHYQTALRNPIRSIQFSFRSYQETAALVSLTNSTIGSYNLQAVLDGGHIRVIITSTVQRQVYKSPSKGFSDGNAHIIKVVFSESGHSVTVDNHESLLQKQNLEKHNVDIPTLDGLVFGAFISNQRQFKDRQYRTLIGCLRDLYVNNLSLSLSEADESYNTYRGYCSDAHALDIWHSCWRWNNQSYGVWLGDKVPDSNTVSMWIASNSTGSLMHYHRQNDFTLKIRIASEGLIVGTGKSSLIIKRPQGQEDRGFLHVVVTDIPESTKVEIEAWQQTVEYSYGEKYGWFSWPEPNVPHSIGIARVESESNKTDFDQSDVFVGSISRLTVGNILINLEKYHKLHNTTSCQRSPKSSIRPQRKLTKEEKPLFCPALS